MRCCLPDCANNTNNGSGNDGITFHRFPEKLHLKNLWMKSLGIVGWVPEDCSAVCSEHFQRDSFYETIHGVRKVKEEAMPVPNIQIPSMLHTTVKTEQNEEEIDVKDVEIKQEPDDHEMAESSNSNNPVTAPLNENSYAVLRQLLQKDVNVKKTEHVFIEIQIKQEVLNDEVPESSTSNSGTACVRDSSGYVRENHEKTDKESERRETRTDRQYTPLSSAEKYKNRYACNLCDYRCKYKSSLLKHSSIHTKQKKYTCTLCDYKSAHSGTFSRHVRRHAKERPYACTICEETFIYKLHLSRHMKTHPRPNRKFSCKLCDYNCEQKEMLSTHMVSHVGEKPFACQLCDYRSKEKRCVAQHMITHAEEKRFACDMCDFRCKDKSQLPGHMLIHIGEKTNVCKICDYRSTRKKSLALHMMTHTGEKPFACQFCEYKCRMKICLNNHMRIHTGEKPFACEICDYRSSRRTYLAAHMNTHTGEKPFACTYCDYRGRQRPHLKRHMMTHTKGNKDIKGKKV